MDDEAEVDSFEWCVAARKFNAEEEEDSAARRITPGGITSPPLSCIWISVSVTASLADLCFRLFLRRDFASISELVLEGL